MESTAAVATAARMMFELPERIGSQTDFAPLFAALAQGQWATLDGVWGSSCALIAAAIRNRLSQTLVIVTAQPDDIDDFYGDWSLFSPTELDRFPAWETEPGERIVHDDVFGDRLRILKKLLDTGDAPEPGVTVVTSIQSLLQPTPSRDALAASSQRLKLGQHCDVAELAAWFVERGFHHTSAVELPGEFSQRGGILDVFAPDWQQPVRIEWFDDEVESLRRFDVTSQRSLEPLKEIEITAVKMLAADRGCFSDSLPASSVILLVEPQLVDQQGRQFLTRLKRPEACHAVPEVMQQLGRFAVLTAAGIAEGHVGPSCHLAIESVERFSGEIDRVRSELDRVGKDDTVFVVSQTEAEVERLSEILRTCEVARAGRLHFPVGSLQHGFRLLRERSLVISAAELFHRGELRRLPRRRQGKAIDSFLELRPGDPVVHLSHGIGRYRGLELLDTNGRVEEYLKIEFHGGAAVYVPASKIGLVQKYVGGTKTRPVLAKIGNKTWVRQKKAAEAAVVDLAAEMLQMQAERQSRPGIAFTDHSDWQREFDASFPYQETPDQLTALEAIRRDMERTRPMDRLLCGDVGFGKTEVAMRAAFRAVDNGYQVALLAPTTVLVEQHFRTFRERMAEFPLDIARLSRFGSTREQREIVRRMAAGQIDIVVGTHRLASRDIRFQNLGLVIIDEEQRFGVEVKERLKSLRSTVDILTLSATPIPRTLHMSLVGVRDISNLETPPEDRMAVETRVTRFDSELIRHAVLRELNRGGQIFFVHNRVNDIRVIEQRLNAIVPEASIRVGHGQMPEQELEDVMVSFVEGEFDLLLATTIVESGLDIPNANTIFIDEAHRYGLADLHQLRGRVGRYKHRAYCYLLVDQNRRITPNAARRLRAIEEFSEMGAGFAIAMRDLEIRGAGNLLGTQQSGHISAVGYELYCQLLETAVLRLKQLPPKISIDIDIQLPGEAYLPDRYVPDMRSKIDLYRRMSRSDGVERLAEIGEEMADRFGPIPDCVRRLLEREELKFDAAIWQIDEILLEGRDLILRYTNASRAQHLARLHHGKLRLVDDRSAYYRMETGISDPDRILRIAKSVLRPS